MVDETNQPDRKPPPPAPEQLKHPEWKIRFVDFINKHVNNAGFCPICNQPVNVADHLVSPVRIEGHESYIGGALYPQVMLICSGCGFTRYFNAVISGAVEKDQ